MARPSLALFVCFVLVFSALAVTPSLSATHQGIGACHPGFVWQSSNMSLWFHGKKAFAKVYQWNESEPENVSAYGYHGGDIIERDASNRTIAKMNLGRAYPQTSNCALEEDANFVNLTLTVIDDVKSVGPGNKLAKAQANEAGVKPGKGGAGTSSTVAQATVQFLYHFNKSSGGVKFDLHVSGWPWLSSGTLAYQWAIDAENGQVFMAENGVGIVNATGAQFGFVEWASKFNATYADAPDEEGDVTATGSASEGHADVQLAFDNATAGYSLLEYDPVIGVGPWVIVNNHLYALPVAAWPSVRPPRLP